MNSPVFDLPWWGYVVVALTITHVTIAAVTIYLHRHMTHRALSLHPVASHFFRFWLWLTTGMVTKEWVAVHRKHHARVETREDPHSPQVLGIKRVFFGGAFLYHTESHKPETLEKYGVGAPDDWVERFIYTPMTYGGPILMLLIDLALFGWAGLGIWITQMIWIPLWAAGVINGVGHYWGYRNFEVKDASRNIVPWAFFIGGEELHNNHHAYASSAKFSVQPWEFDLGWVYIRGLEKLGLAKVNKTVPRLVVVPDQTKCDVETVQAVLGNHFQVMANFVSDVVRQVWREEVRKLRNVVDKEEWVHLKSAGELLIRDDSRLDSNALTRLKRALALSPRLQTVYQMKQRLQSVWSRSSASAESLRQMLDEWCESAELSGIEVLREFSSRLKGYRLQTSM